MYPVWSLSFKHDENLNEISNVYLGAVQNSTILNAKYWGGKKRKGRQQLFSCKNTIIRLEGTQKQFIPFILSMYLFPS